MPSRLSRFLQLPRLLFAISCLSLGFAGPASAQAAAYGGDSIRLARSGESLSAAPISATAVRGEETSASSAGLDRPEAESAVAGETPSARFPSLIPEPADAPASDGETASLARTAGPILTMTSSLAVVLGLFAALVWVTRRFGGRRGAAGHLPQDAIETLGSHPLDPRTRLMLIRCGRRVLVVAHTAAGVQPISEIRELEEARELVALCRGQNRQAFRQTLRELEQEPSSPGFVDTPPKPTRPAGRGRLFATA